MVKSVGYGTTTFLGVCYFAAIIGEWAEVGAVNEDIKLIFKVLGIVAFVLAMGCWRLADSLMGGD